MKKRRESGLVTACLGYLEVHKNMGHIKAVERLNSGQVHLGGGRCPFCKKVSKNRTMRLCSAGTPDIMVILNDYEGTMLWIECKTEKGKPSPEQEEFKKIEQKASHHHIYATSVECVRQKLKQLGADIV